MKNSTRVLVLAALLSVGLTACHSKPTGNTATDSTSTMSGKADSTGGGTSGMAADTTSSSSSGGDSTQMKDSTKR